MRTSLFLDNSAELTFFHTSSALDTLGCIDYVRILDSAGNSADRALAGAGGTALATGIRTGNGRIGVYNDDPYSEASYPKNLTELCMENGMMTGVITTDTTSGATPASTNCSLVICLWV